VSWLPETSRFSRRPALPNEAGSAPVSWLLYSVSTCSAEPAAATSGSEPLRFMLPAAQRGAPVRALGAALQAAQACSV